MCRVLISYRQSGTSVLAHLLHSDLQAELLSLKAHEVFWDTRHNGGGDDFEAKVWAALDVAEVFVVLLDEYWLNEHDENGFRRLAQHEDFCRRELDKALQRSGSGERIVVIPVCCNGLSTPDKSELPDSLHEVLTLLHMRRDAKDSFTLIAALVDRVGKCLGLEADKTTRVSRSSETESSLRFPGSDISRRLESYAIETLQHQIADLAGQRAGELTAALLAALRRLDVTWISSSRDNFRTGY